MLHDVRQWKLYISVWTKTIERYDEIQTKILIKFKNKIKNYLSFQSVKSQTYLARRLNSKKKAKVDIKGSPENVELKPAELKLINLLKKNSRLSIVELSKKLNTNVSSVMRRINSLKKREIILRFYPIIDMKKIGYTEYTYISRVDPSCVKELESFMKMIMRTGRSYEPVLAPTYIFKYGTREMFQEVQTASALILKGRMPLLPKRIKRIEHLREVVRRIVPIGGSS